MKPKTLFSSFVVLGALISFANARRMTTCAGGGIFVRQVDLLNNLALGWDGIGVGLLLIAAMVHGMPVWKGWVVSYLPLGIFALFNFFVMIHVPCLVGNVWYLFLLGILGLLAFGLGFPNLKSRLALSVFSLIFTLGLLEGGARATMRLLPIDTAWPIAVDEKIGWHHVPKDERVWSGHDPACVSFRTPMKFNTEGFYDVDHTIEKPAYTRRVAMIGDSFVEAAQVDFDARVSSVLEDRLNRELAPFEVLNFGISNFSVVQFMLTYEAYAAKYQPDFVFINLFFTQFLRNTQQSGYAVGEQGTDTLQLRPVAVLNEQGAIEIIPPDPADMATYQQLVQERLMNKDGELQPQYVYAPLPRDSAPFLENPYDWLVSHSFLTRIMQPRLNALWNQYYGVSDVNEINTDSALTYEQYQQGQIFATASDNDLMQLHFILLRDFADKVRADGGELVIMNYAQTPVYEALRYFAQDNRIGYIDLTAVMAEARQKGDVNFLCDSHWNTYGNEVVADAMYDWIEQRLTQPFQIYASASIAVFEQPDGAYHVYRIVDGQGMYTAQFLPTAMTADGLKIETEDGWLVEVQANDNAYHLIVYNERGKRVDDQFFFKGKP